MKPKVTIVDYGSGNVLSVGRALAHCGADVALSNDPDLIRHADRLVLPGVGAFANCMGKLKSRGLPEPIQEFVRSGRPFLGICVGMQILFDESEEFGKHEGLGLLPGKVVKIPSSGVDGKVHSIPFIGWSSLSLPAGRNSWKDTILENIQPRDSAYFLHSFTAQPSGEKYRLADTSYDGCDISAAVQHENIIGTQFHLEKSGPVGLKIVSRFLQL